MGVWEDAQSEVATMPAPQAASADVWQSAQKEMQTAKPAAGFLAGQKESKAIERQTHESSGGSPPPGPVYPPPQVCRCDELFDLNQSHLSRQPPANGW